MAKGHGTTKPARPQRPSQGSMGRGGTAIPNETCVIQPERSHPLWKWDTLCAFLLVLVAILTPFEAGFLEGDLFSWMGIFNIITNLFFLIDMLMQFFIAYPIETRYGPRWILQKRLIAVRYLKGWFAIDLASTLPLDYLSPGSGLGLLRTIRLLRLLKLLRLARGIRVVRRYQAEFGLSYRKMTLYLLFFSVLAVSHWLACTLGIVHKFAIEHEICSRLDLEEGRTDCSTSWLTEGMRYHADWGDSENPTVDIFEAYIMAFYTGITILVHPHAHEATGTGERLLFTILLLIGGFMWTQVISRSTAIASSLNAHQLAHQQTMDDLNNIANRLSLSFDMKVRLRKFFLRSQAQHEYQAWQEILSRMSPQLRRDTYREVNVHWVKKVRFFDGCSTSFLTGIAEILEIKMFAEQEHFGQLFHMYIMMGGTASRVINFNLLLPGMIWGEDHLLLSNPDLVCSNIAVSLTVVEVQELSKEGFDSVLQDFPDHAQILRREVVKFIVIRGVKRFAQLTLQAREKQEGLTRSPTASPASAWNKRLSGDDTEKSATSPELNHGETLELDGNAQSVIDGARLISMQYNAAKHRFSKDLAKIPISSQSISGGSKLRSESRRSQVKRESQGKRKPIHDAGTAAAVAWYSPMDAAAAATAAAVQAADSTLGEKFTDWNMRQDELEESVFSRLDELSEQVYSIHEMLEEQQELMSFFKQKMAQESLREEVLNDEENGTRPSQSTRSSTLSRFRMFQTLPSVPKKPDLRPDSDDMPKFQTFHQDRS